MPFMPMHMMLSKPTPPEEKATDEERPSEPPIEESLPAQEPPQTETPAPEAKEVDQSLEIALDEGAFFGSAGIDRRADATWEWWEGDGLPGSDAGEEVELPRVDENVNGGEEAPPPPAEMEPAFPISRNERVEYYIKRFQTDQRDVFARYLSRSTMYLSMMEEIMREHGLPEELTYMALIESGFSAHAYSRARAMGPWQFIKSTGRRYGLRIDWWVDERKDPVKSTQAAARYLKDLYNIFGSWELAMAAYNAGEKGVQTAIRRAKTRDWWELSRTRYLKRETRNYVPQIMAAIIIAREPEKYGFTDIEYTDPFRYDEVVVDESLSLKQVARLAGSSVSLLRGLNPELLRGYTPPHLVPYRFRVPYGSGERFVSSYKKTLKGTYVAWRRHKIRRGETLSGLAEDYGTTVRAIMRANNIKDPRRVKAGINLVIPRVMASKSDGAGGSEKDRQTNVGKGTAGYDGDDLVHVIRRGESLYKIARRYGSSVRAIMDANGLSSSHRIYAGNRLVIPVKSSPSSDRPVLLNKPVSIGDYDRPARPRGVVYHRVKRGQSLSKIAALYGTTVKELARLNGIKDPRRLRIGRTLKVPIPSDRGNRAVKMASRGGEIYHTVRRGESLWLIARNYGVSLKDLKKWNQVDGSPLIRTGDRLKIYVEKEN